MARKISYGVGAHEPIYHRLRTGNANAEEWERWKRETSIENLDLLERLGFSKAHLPCTKGFGLEYEKPLIERAAKFAEEASKRGIETDVYVQGFPIYYETFLEEKPEAVDWLAKDQNGCFIPWGSQTFRRWIDPTSEAFLEYQKSLFTYILAYFQPKHFMMDNTQVAPVYTPSALASWRKYMENKFSPEQAFQEFGIRSFKALDLPVFDPIYYPIDAYQIVKDPIMQEWCYWRAKITDDFLKEIKTHIQSIAPKVELYSPSGCEGLRYNHLFRAGINFEERIDLLDSTHMEESSWRPRVYESSQNNDLQIVMDERTPDAKKAAEKSSLRVSTNARWGKIYHNYRKVEGGLGFWGETTRETKMVALSHGFAFAHVANETGPIGPLCADERMLDDIKDVFAWASDHMEILEGRDKKYSPVGVWRSTNTLAFIRHRPVWEACVMEQMLFENHIPFDILLDNGLERFLQEKKLLVLPGSSCVSQKQVQLITSFVEAGGRLLLIGDAGTRDERTRVRSKHAFAHLFGSAMPNLEFMGPPHWVPTLDISLLPEYLEADYGKGKVVLIKKLQEIAPLDLTRDPYMPERQVFTKDIVPPKNEKDVIGAITKLLGENALKVEAPRWVLSEFWQQGKDLLICLANLKTNEEGRDIVVYLNDIHHINVDYYEILQCKKTITIEEQKMKIPNLKHFACLLVKDFFKRS